VRILIAGLGAIGQRHGRNLRALYGDRLELLAFRRRRLPYVITDSLGLDTMRDVETELNLTVFEDLDRALAAQPDAVFVCTPSSEHVSIAQQAAAAGCHLFIEKPVSHTLEGVEQLLSTVSSKNLVAQVGCQWRFHPAVGWLRELLHAGTFGQLLHAEIDYAEYLPDVHPYEDYRSSYAARADLGGGVVLTQIHDYDLAWWLFGPPRSVTASGGHLSDLEIDVEDTVHAQIECVAGPVCIRQTFASGPPRRTVTIAAERGAVVVDLLSGRITADFLDAPALPEPYLRNQMFVDEIRHFGSCLTGSAKSVVTLEDGVGVLRFALAVKDAMRTGCEVKIS